MDDRDKTYLLKELTKTIDGSDSTAAFCLCQRWILKDALVMLKEQESVLEALKSDLDETLAVLGEQPEIVRCKDCVNSKIRPEHRNEKYALGRCDNISYLVGPYWFCADGERR